MSHIAESYHMLSTTLALYHHFRGYLPGRTHFVAHGIAYYIGEPLKPL
jgi:hypothetical protein